MVKTQALQTIKMEEALHLQILHQIIKVAAMVTQIVTKAEDQMVIQDQTVDLIQALGVQTGMVDQTMVIAMEVETMAVVTQVVALATQIKLIAEIKTLEL